MKYLFNWNELKNCSNNEYEAILILTYCIIIGYNNLLAKNSRHLLKKLSINKIPLYLFRNKYLKFSKGTIISFYKCNEPQSYFKNTNFCFFECNITQKIRYLYMLSYRPIYIKENYIPKTYINRKYWNNIFIKQTINKLYFIPELTKQRKLIK